MRYIFPAFFLAALVVVFSCSRKQNATKSFAGSATDLSGTWELQEAQNGMMPAKQYAAGNGNFFRFTSSTFEQYRDGKQERAGSYTVVRDTTVTAAVGLEFPAGQFAHRITFDNDTTADKTFIDRRGDTLELLTGFFPVDAGSRQTYVKVKDNR